MQDENAEDEEKILIDIPNIKDIVITISKIKNAKDIELDYES